jgi:hypothetical protein
MMMRLLVFVVALLATTLWASPVAAQSELDAKRDQARPIALEGLDLFQAGKHHEAIAKLEEAERIFHAPTHLLYIGRARKELGELLTAYEVFIDIVLEDIPNYVADQFQKAQAEARTEAAALASQIATVTIRVRGAALAGAMVSIDDQPIASSRLAHPIGITPGTHRVTVTAGEERGSESVQGVVGENAVVELVLTAPTGNEEPPIETEPDSGFPVLGTVVLAVGAGALVAGAVTGVLTLNQASDIKARCINTMCPLSQQQAAEDAKVIGNVSTAMFVIGGVLAATGIVLIIVDPLGGSTSEEVARTKQHDRLRLGFRVAPLGASLIGSF